MLRWLAQVNAGMGESVGGKAANLGELLRAGFRVPAGFVVTTDAYDEVCRDPVAELIDQLPGSAGEIRARISTLDLPAELSAAITTAYAELGQDVPVAVRSSATAEDLPFASFAGQQDTYLGVLGAEQLLDAVRRCWASLWTDRAVAYRDANGIDHHSVRLAVVVQLLVDAAAAGVLFTANPVTGRRAESVIDASRGLGESVVSGSVTPDSFLVTAGEVTARLGDKPTAVRPKPGGGVETVEERHADASITEQQARELAEIGLRVAAHYGAPQDIEWAIDEHGTPWLTQSRPITTLFPLPPETRPGLRIYGSINLVQGLHRPITPMGIATLGLLFTGLTGRLGIPTAGEQPSAFRDADGWLFLDITGTTGNPIGRAVLPRILSVAERRTARVYESLLRDPRFPAAKGIPWWLVRRLGRALLAMRVPQRLIGALREPDRARESAFAVIDELRGDLDTRPSGARECLADARRALLEAPSRVMPLPGRVLPIVGLSHLLPRIVGDAATAEELQVVLAGIPHNVTTEMNLQLWGITDRLSPDTARMLTETEPAELANRYRDRDLPSDVLSGLDLFLSEHGHRAVAEIDVGMPRWIDDPEPVFGLLASYLRSADAGHDAAEQYRGAARQAEAKLAEIAARVRNPVRARIARFAMSRVRALAGLRELPKYCMVLVIAHARDRLRSVGSELACQQRISHPDDVFFLNYREVGELLDGADHRDRIAERRARYQRELRRNQLPPILLSDGTQPEADIPSTSTENRLDGTSASAGTVTGTARVVLDPTRAHLEPGEILVAPSTDPGWTPLFFTAAGLVMEMGGPNSHGATVAREYGIPAVVGVAGATARIRDGQTITVRATAGVVEVHES